MNMKTRMQIGGFAVFALFTGAALADGLDGNRYGQDRQYHSEISSAQTYIALQQYLWPYDPAQRQPMTIIDVRTIEEYIGGHPPAAYSIPYPHVFNRSKDPNKGEYIAQPNAEFVKAVDALGLPKDSLIVTVCRTGSRSIGASNLLAEAGYTNVRNMWDGFVGLTRKNTLGEELDLNNDGKVDGKDPYSGDLDGWANFQGLPVEMKLDNERLFAPYANLYHTAKGER